MTDLSPVPKSVGESGFDDGDACGQTSGDVTPTRETVVTSTLVPGPLPHASESTIVCEGRGERLAEAPGTDVPAIIVHGSAGKPTTVHGSAGKPIPPEKPPTRVLQNHIGQLFPWRAVGPDNSVNPQFGVGVQDRATGLDSQLGAELHSRASEHIPPSWSVELWDHANGYGDDLLGGLVWRDEALRANGIPPQGTALRDRASGSAVSNGGKW
jgi:hypothetical protein